MYITRIKDFFEPKCISYDILLPINEVLQKFEEILNTENEISDSDIFKGSITDKQFVMSLISAGTQEASFSSSLRGTISAQNSRQTRVEVYILRDSSTYLAFFFSLIAAVICFITYYSNPENTKSLFWGLGILMLGISFSIWLSNGSIKIIQSKFEFFLNDIGVTF